MNTPTAAGQTELRAGHYLVKVNGAYAEFLNIEQQSQRHGAGEGRDRQGKFENTAVDTKTENGVSQIESIQLRDTNSKLEF